MKKHMGNIALLAMLLAVWGGCVALCAPGVVL